MKIYVGNLGKEVTVAELRQVFEAYGTVSSVAISYDETGQSRKSRGFAFVEMPRDREAQAALDALCGYEMNGHLVIVR
jgi:RNA recognition motif-containing protein